MGALGRISGDKESLYVAGMGESLQVSRNSMEAQEVFLIDFKGSIPKLQQDCIKKTSQNKAILFLLLTQSLPNTLV